MSLSCHSCRGTRLPPWAWTSRVVVPLVIVLVTRRLPATSGVVAAPAGWKTSGYSQLRDPSSGLTASSRRVVMKTTSGSLPGCAGAANRTGDDVLLGSSYFCHKMLPVALSKATSEQPLPPTLRSTTLPTISGEQHAPNFGTAWLSFL